jgi:chromosome partitioning protein
MKTLAVLSRKGGSGKTTTSAHLGAMAETDGRRVLFIDCDPQRSLTEWWRSRPHKTPLLVEGDGAGLRAILEAAEEGGIDLVIIDTRPAHEDEVQLAAASADLGLVVVRPSILDLRAAAGTVSALRKTDTPGAFLMNGAPSKRGTYENAMVHEARKALEGYGLPILKSVVRNRATFSAALIDGRAAHELEPKGAAAADVRALWSELKGMLWPAQS